MGMRQNIALKYKDTDSKIYLYSHWSGDVGMSPLKRKLQQALIRGKGRWNDESYLSRIIFSELVKNEILGDTGYGIAPYEMDKNYPTIEVDLENQTVDLVPFNVFITI